MKRFFPALLLAALVTLSSPFVGLIRDALFDHFPRQAVLGLSVALAAVGLALLVLALVRIRHDRLPRYGGLAVVGVLLWIQAVGFRTGLAQVNVVEKIHILEYGLLAFLLYRAFHPAGDFSALLLTVLWATFAGTVEEGVQWCVETRTGEIRDVLLNGLSSVCGLVFGLSLSPPEKLSWRIAGRRWRVLGASSAALVLALGAFFTSAHLGYLIDDPEIGRFRSYFTREELVVAAAVRAAEWSANPPRDLSPWRQEDLFLTEAGWHSQHRNDAYDRGFFYLARQANLILEKYYTPYLDLESFRRAGNRRFPPGQVQELDAKAPRYPPRDYLSPVGESRITTWPSKPLFVTFVVAVAFFLWALPILLTRRG